MVEAPKHNMVYRYLGPTGMKVSVMGYGNYCNYNQVTEEAQSLSD